MRATNRQNKPLRSRSPSPAAPGELDDLGRDGEPIVDTRRIPQRVKAGVEHLSQRPFVADTSSELNRFVDELPPPRTSGGITQELMSEAAQERGPHLVVMRSPER